MWPLLAAGAAAAAPKILEVAKETLPLISGFTNLFGGGGGQSAPSGYGLGFQAQKKLLAQQQEFQSEELEAQRELEREQLALSENLAITNTLANLLIAKRTQEKPTQQTFVTAPAKQPEYTWLDQINLKIGNLLKG